MELRNLELLNQLFFKTFGNADQEVIMQVAVDNLIYGMTPASERHKLKTLNNAYILQSSDNVIRELEALKSSVEHSIDFYKGFPYRDTYGSFKDLLTEIVFLINKLDDKIMSTAEGIVRCEDLKIREGILSRQAKSNAVAAIGSVISKPGYSEDTVWSVHAVDQKTGVSVRKLFETTADNEATAIFNWAIQYSPSKGSPTYFFIDGACILGDYLVKAFINSNKDIC